MSLHRSGSHDRFDEDWISQLLADSAMPLAAAEIDLWVGHDVITGAAAIRGAKTSGKSKSALIMHMNYEAYKSFQKGDADEAQKRFLEQQEMFRHADFLFGNGPLLSKALRNMVGRDVKMLVPGFPKVAAATVRDEMRVVAFGRMERGNDIIKQGGLAAAAYGTAVKRITDGDSHELKDWPKKLKIFGVDTKDEEEVLKGLAQSRGGTHATVLPLSYEENRETILDELSRANIALMPSWHDGFGMTGWEAIAAETPLILSRHTGLWLLLSEKWSAGMAKGLVGLVEVDGRQDEGNEHFTEKDEVGVAGAILEIVSNLKDRIFVAEELKRMLQEKCGCTWDGTAEEFLVAVKFVTPREETEAAFAGEWKSFFVEGSVLREPEIVREDVFINRDERTGKLKGSSTYKVRDQGREELFFDMVARRGVLAGATSTTNWGPNDGWARFQVASHSGGDLLEGVVSWSSVLRTDVDWSRYIWVRKGINNEALMAYAEAEMATEADLVTARLARRKALAQRGT